MPSLLSAALGLFLDSGCELVYLDEAPFHDPIVPAEHAGLFETLRILYCCDTGANPAFYSVRRIVDWLSKAEHYPGYADADGSRKARTAHA
jgi:hypothetical protein